MGKVDGQLPHLSLQSLHHHCHHVIITAVSTLSCHLDHRNPGCTTTGLPDGVLTATVASLIPVSSCDPDQTLEGSTLGFLSIFPPWCFSTGPFVPSPCHCFQL